MWTHIKTIIDIKREELRQRKILETEEEKDRRDLYTALCLAIGSVVLVAVIGYIVFVK